MGSLSGRLWRIIGGCRSLIRSLRERDPMVMELYVRDGGIFTFAPAFLGAVVPS